MHIPTRGRETGARRLSGILKGMQNRKGVWGSAVSLVRVRVWAWDGEHAPVLPDPRLLTHISLHTCPSTRLWQAVPCTPTGITKDRDSRWSSGI
eukprot:364355-Chlamydomonas_euryale.AAC.13